MHSLPVRREVERVEAEAAGATDASKIQTERETEIGLTPAM